ncbi:LytTR family DNA-binding domain-containing protein [Elizabethkingia anophelis]|uniref:DNA-binding response regulator n=1 Tax=Elizabethkingia anophelis TaxID=1117645 RepID=A0AAU8VGS9_9FLAO|nr:LytTR family DNA-binding domain-containing protein [Elizabethkingia anophelis]AQW92839.1 DNA-binding response regulator [Elizabethkingia anophelis]AQX02390.1 DNA-binding response regulator [Elizabethkingia anophelis]EQB93412.1 LytTR family transcriptional regulator [Elizabethkingia anophelis 502]MCL1032608.1 LytTR family DNA-binding domain-containing protein [Elizabethkingia anophelis]MCT3698265.1 response regulator transcription factor [Elizabethkingia anophelis]
MEKLNCIIIDDEPLGREVIESFVQGIPFLSLIKSYGDPTEALLYLQNNTVDIVFSDIQMPKINGMELVKSLSNPPVIIFITAHRDFALDGFDTGATDYLVKPVRFDRFLKAVNRAKDYIALKQIPSIQQVNTDRIFIKSEGKLVKILLDEILYVEAQGDYLKIVIDSATYTTQATLKSMEEILISPDFFRVQRSFILNTEAIRSVNANMVELINGKTISIALNKKDELFSLLGIK